MARPKRIALFLAGFAILAAVALLVASRALGPFASGKLVSALAQRGLDAEIEGLRISPGGAQASRLCIEPAEGSAGPLCIIDLEVGLDGLAQLRPVPSSVRFASANVDLSAQHGPIEAQIAAWRAAAGPLGSDRSSTPETTPDAPEKPRTSSGGSPLIVDARSIFIDATGQALPLEHLLIDRVDARLDGDAVTVAAHVSGTADATGLPAGLQLPPGFEINAHVDTDHPLTVTVRGDEPVRLVAPPPIEGLSASVSAVTFASPYTFSFEAIRIEQTGATEPIVDVPTAALSLRELTLDPEELYFGALEVSSPTVVVELDENGFPAALAAALSAAEGSGELAAPPSAEGSGEPEAAGDALWADREWWQKIPQSIAVTNARVVAYREGQREQAVELALEQLNYALRIFNFQLDVTVRAALQQGGQPAGNVRLDGVWGWQNSNLQLDARLEDIDLDALSEIAGSRAGTAARGRLDLETRFAEAARGPGLDFRGTLSLEDFALVSEGSGAEAERTREIGTVSYTWNAARTEGDEDPLVFRFTQGDLVVNGARASIRPAFHRFNHQRTPFAHRIDLPFEVPAQSAATLVEAVPAWLLGPLDGMQLGGEFGGWSSSALALEAWQDDAQQWRWRPVWPDDWNWQNGTMELLALPDAVDVRKLNGSFEFTWTGLDGSAPRVIQVPSPRGSSVGSVEPSEEVGAPGEESPGWVRLDDVSWFLIATQLYREDGSFFRNSGINFLQMRNVIDEAFEIGRFTRGASTISMQLVKNVFLSHERTVERKFQELILTYWMTRLVPKERILEVYLNIIEWGPGIHGVSEAASTYFGVRPSELTIGQAVWLSAITPRPLRWSLDAQRGRVSDWMQRNVRDLLEGLAGRGLITTDERDRGLAETITFGPPSTDATAAVPSTTPGAAGSATLADLPVPAELSAPVAVNGDGSLAPASDLLSRPPEQRIGFVVQTMSRPLAPAAGSP